MKKMFARFFCFIVLFFCSLNIYVQCTRAYVTNQTSNNVSVINTATNTVVATVTVGTTPAGVSVSPDGSFVYVTNRTSNNVSVINTATNTVVATVTVGTDPVGV